MTVFIHLLCNEREHAVAQLLAECRGFEFCNFSLTSYFRTHYGSGFTSASNKNEYQEYFLGGKGGRCVALKTYHIYGPNV
jgi:hypothetical protein